MNDDSSLSCWARVVFLVLEDEFFFNRKNQIFWLFLLEISAISHEKVKKQTTKC